MYVVSQMSNFHEEESMSSTERCLSYFANSNTGLSGLQGVLIVHQ